MSNINLDDWLLKEVGTGTDMGTGIPGGPPMGQPSMGGMPPPANDPSIASPPPSKMGTPPKENNPNEKESDLPDVANDPQVPDMPEENESQDFEAWKKKFLVESIKGDVQSLKDMIHQVRDRNLEPYQRRFVEDNLQILFLREHSNVAKISKEIRKQLKEQIDHNNPGTTVVNHMTAVLDQEPLLNGCFIKLTGLLGMKADIHRKFIAGLLGAVQVGSGAYNEDLIYNEKDYSIRISTRFNSRFGEVHLGEWSLKEDDPERYLKSIELKRLEEGSPEEKEVLRRRVIMESISQEFKTRAFIINVVGTDGTVYTVGWDLATSLKAAYTEGKLVVRTKHDDNVEAMIDDDGAIIPMMDIKILYAQETGDQDEEGKPEKREIEFIARKNGHLFLVAPLPIVKEASTTFQGIVFKETPWQGNPSDLRTLARCVPTLPDIIMRQCQ
jgi:hypothetical protein